MEQIKQRLLRDIERLNGCYDPLIITLNRIMFWDDCYNIYCNPDCDIDENYLRKGSIEIPNKYSYSSKRCRITSKVKYVRLQIN